MSPQPWRDRYPNAVQRPYDGGAQVGTITHGGPNQHLCWWCRGSGRTPDSGKCAGCNGWGWYADGPRDLVTPSRTDRQPPASPSKANSGETPVRPGTTKHPDLVTHHEES